MGGWRAADGGRPHTEVNGRLLCHRDYVARWCYDYLAMKRITLTAAMLFVPLALAARPAQAQVTITPGSDAAAFASSVGMTTEQLTTLITNRVDGLFQVTNVNSFLRDFQNAQSFSSKGLGVDYASEATLVEAGATLSLASNVDKAYKPSGSYSDPPISGGGANFSLMGGLGLGLFGLDPVMIFANWFKGSASLGQLDGKYQNWGLHGQLRLLGPSRGLSATKFLIRWGGIAITSGVDYAHVGLSTNRKIASTFDVAAGAPITVTSAGTLSFTLDQTTWSVPLEVTTSLRLLSMITVYGGLGFDWQLGGDCNLHVLMEGANLSGKAQGTTYNNLGTADVHADGHVSPSPARMREIFGLQLGIMDVVRIFAQVNTTASSPVLTSLAMGLRVGI
jgi:hypothetical protein